MKRGTSSAPTLADHRRADAALDERGLACVARGCPRRWSTNLDGALLCSAHAGMPVWQWRAITERLLWMDAEVGRVQGAKPVPRRDLLGEYPAPASNDGRERLQALQVRIAARRNIVEVRWLELRERERAGDALTRYQAAAWRAGLRLPADADAWDAAWFERGA